MITFIILLATLLALALVAFILFSVGGIAFLVVFGDVIICTLIIVWIVKRIFGKRKGR